LGSSACGRARESCGRLRPPTPPSWGDDHGSRGCCRGRPRHRARAQSRRSGPGGAGREPRIRSLEERSLAVPLRPDCIPSHAGCSVPPCRRSPRRSAPSSVPGGTIPRR